MVFYMNYGINFTDETVEAMEELAAITGVKTKGPARFANLIQDALRLYEWIINQQTFGREIAALNKVHVKLVRENRFSLSEEEFKKFLDEQILVSMIDDCKIEMAKEYFKKTGLKKK